MALRYGNILIIGFSLQGTVLNIILTMYCNVICTGLPLGLFSTLVFFWKRHVILRDSRIYLMLYIIFNC